MARTKSRSKANRARKKAIASGEIAPEDTVEESAPRKAPKLTRQEATAQQLEMEYAYIVKDLRRVFIIAGIMFGLLITANIVLGFVAG